MKGNKKKSVLQDALVLFCITIISGLLLGLVYVVTAKPIAQRTEQKKKEAYQKVCSAAASFEETTAVTEVMQKQAEIFKVKGLKNVSVTELLVALDENGVQVGCVMTVVSGSGYGGDITMAIGVDVQGRILGLEFLELEETAGLGMNAKKDTFRGQFYDKSVEQFVVVKGEALTEGEIVALSSATITSKAVTDGVNAALALQQALQATSASEGEEVQP